jgi:uncharacterized phiE125 gp8 family phage protein
VKYVVFEGPGEEPLTLEQAREHLQFPPADQNAQIEEDILAARQYVELWCDRVLMPQTWLAAAPAFPPVIALRGGQFRQLLEIRYVDAAGSEQVMPESDYFLDDIGEPALLIPRRSWPATATQPNAVRVKYKVGYADADAVPTPLVKAMKLIVGDLFENREAQIVGQSYAQNETLSRLLMPYRRMVL